MRIAHISDLHIRNFKYRDEYKAAFEDLYRQLEELKPDLVINTGDSVHSKLAVSPELFDDVADHMRAIAKIAPYWIILGNHDLNLKNKSRTDAISPIVRALRDNNITLMDDRSRSILGPNAPFWWEKGSDSMSKHFWHFDIRGNVDPAKFNIDDSRINIGLFHGSVSGCKTDMDFVMENCETDVSEFDKMDYVLLGDIHKRQSFRGGRIAYPGSLIQQNYGEELIKGFLLWDIRSKEEFSTTFHPVSAPGRFYTIQVPASLDIADIDIPVGSRIRAKVDGELTPSKRWDLEKRLRELFAPLEVITPDASAEKTQLDATTIDELIGSRDKLMRDHLSEKGITGEVAEAVIKQFAQFEQSFVGDESSRGTTWKLDYMFWENMLNYGDSNIIEMTKIPGLVGIFAPNASGKSSIFDIMLEALFDKISKEVPRNIDLVNDNKDAGRMVVELTSAGKKYKIDREIERIHYGQRKLTETKQWGKTMLDFVSLDPTGGSEDEQMNGTSRPETEKNIRRIIGSFEDFCLTTMVSQGPIFGIPGGGDIINCKETDRRKILFRFLDLDLYEKVNTMAKDEFKAIMVKLKGLNRDDILAKFDKLEENQLTRGISLNDTRLDLVECERVLAAMRLELVESNAEDVEKLLDESKLLADTFKKCCIDVDKQRREIIDIEKKLDVADTRLAELRSNSIDIPSLTLEDLAMQMKDLRETKSQSAIEITRSKDALARGKKSLKTLDGVPCEGKFPTCKFISEASQFIDEREAIETILSKHTTAADDASSALSALELHEVQHKSVAKWNRDIASFELESSKLSGLISLKSAMLADSERWFLDITLAIETNNEKLESSSSGRIAGLKGEIARKEAEARSLQREADVSLKALGALDAAMLTLGENLIDLDDLASTANMYEILLEMTGKTGLPYRILKMVLPVINAEIAKILAGVAKFAVFFEEDADEQTVSLYIRYGDYKSRPLSLGSGAEKFISSLAVRVALLSVSSLPKTDFLIIDEGFGKLDPEYLEALQRMFEYLKGAFGTVFIISHVDSMRDIVDHSIEITSLNGYANVSVK